MVILWGIILKFKRIERTEKTPSLGEALSLNRAILPVL